MLKEYGIRNVISSPGCQNSMFNLLIQNDNFFNCYSVTDERSAAYMAIGIAEETNEPAVITCTGASASRNYVPALTEAFYRNIPVIAIPFYNRNSSEFNLYAQYTNRQVTQNDIKSIQVRLNEIADITDKKQVLVALNAAFSTAKYNKKPVIIECPSNFYVNNYDNFKEMPTDIWHTTLVEEITNEQDEVKKLNAAIYIGSHTKFSNSEQKAVSEFAKSYNMPVFCDHTSNYYGDNKVLTAKALLCRVKKPDLIIDIGGVSGDHFAIYLFSNAKIWRVTPDRSFKFRHNLPVEKTFCMYEKDFFTQMKNNNKPLNNYYNEVIEMINKRKFPDVPLSNYLIINNLAKYIPEGSSLHYGVSTTKIMMNYNEFSETIDTSCNVGACGIDGAVSTLVGHSISAPNKMCFGVMGDLTFFYDMNALQNRDIKNNLRIILVNNNKGILFKVNGLFPGADTEKLIGSAGHKTTANGWAQSCGFHYMYASTKESFLSQIKDFCTKKYDKPVFFEVFISDEDEINSFNLIMKVSKNG